MLVPKEQLKIILKGVHQCVNEEELLEKLENHISIISRL